MDGLLIVDKPAGVTSAEVVRVVKRTLRCKTGHLGTLDPFATGVLPVCLGEGTKIAPFLNQADKEYAGSIALGVSTDTGDLMGKQVAEAPVPHIESDRLEATRRSFLGALLQTPPMYSALKHGGTPLYRLARRGITVEREARPVRIDSLRLDLQGPDTLAFVVACSKGTYVRTLAEDIAGALGTVGHLRSLRRTRFGRFGLADAVPLDFVAGAAGRIISLRDALGDLSEFRLGVVDAARARVGTQGVLSALPSPTTKTLAQLLDGEGRLVAVVEGEPRMGWRYLRVFSAPSVDRGDACGNPMSLADKGPP